MSEPSELPMFDDLADLFLQIGALESPAALHGYLAGYMVAGVEVDQVQWLTLVTEYLDTPLPEDRDLTLLGELYSATQEQLAENLFGFRLLLPDDEASLQQRVESLGQWSQGFLSGFAIAGGQPDSLGEDASESLEDLVSISQIAFDDGDAEDEEAEQAFFEVSDYLRMAVLTLCGDQFVPDEQAAGQGDSPERNSIEQSEQAAISSPASLFGAKKTLH